MTKLEMREAVNNIVNGYCETYNFLCNKDKVNSSIYYMEFIHKIIGVFDLLSYDYSFTCEEHEAFLTECLGKIHEIYHNYN
nr:MAG TPA: hypothetical protein [Caudoviricetes sp.]